MWMCPSKLCVTRTALTEEIEDCRCSDSSKCALCGWWLKSDTASQYFTNLDLFSRFSYVIIGDFRVLVTSWWSSPGRNTPSCQFRATLAPLIRALLAKPSTCGKSYGAELFWSPFLLIGLNETRKGFIIFKCVAVEMSKTCGPPHSGKGKLCMAMRATNKNKHHI